MFPTDFFVSIPAALYDFVRITIFFVFDYSILSDQVVDRLVYVNPFSGVGVLYDFPVIGQFGGGFLGQTITGILNFFDIIPDITFWDLLTGPVLIIVLAYAFVKYLIPIN